MWQLKIQDPSGETRICHLPSSSRKSMHLSLGRQDSEAQIQLRDPTLPPLLGNLSREKSQSTFWLQMDDHAPAAVLADIEIRRAQIPPLVRWRLGETQLMIEPTHDEPPVPSFPHGLKHWKTDTSPGREVLWTAKKAAATELSIYLRGETGTGKEVLSQLVHAWSPRASGAFVPLHCSAFAVSLAESELFGHVKGAFTGASHNRPGALIQAHGGTLFLDEIGDLSLEMQVKLLRFLENGEIRAVGSDRTTHANVRLVCATHRPLETMVEKGLFRQDLYYRLASITVEIPPLRTRLKDVEYLAQEFSAEMRKTISTSALHRLKTHSWPGNVRELRHAVERAAGLAGPWTPILTEEAFDFLFRSSSRNLHAAHPGDELAGLLSLREVERKVILRALRMSEGHRGKTARMLGIARSTLFEKIKKHRIQGPKIDFSHS